jgi:hypothetical protein
MRLRNQQRLFRLREFGVIRPLCSFHLMLDFMFRYWQLESCVLHGCIV